MASLRWLRGIMERDVSDGLVSGTKCTEEFLVAVTMTLNYRLFWSSLLSFTSTVQ